MPGSGRTSQAFSALVPDWFRKPCSPSGPLTAPHAPNEGRCCCLDHSIPECSGNQDGSCAHVRRGRVSTVQAFRRWILFSRSAWPALGSRYRVSVAAAVCSGPTADVRGHSGPESRFARRFLRAGPYCWAIADHGWPPRASRRTIRRSAPFISSLDTLLCCRRACCFPAPVDVGHDARGWPVASAESLERLSPTSLGVRARPVIGRRHRPWRARHTRIASSTRSRVQRRSIAPG